MIPVSRAEHLVLKTARLLSPEKTRLNDQPGRILREDIRADRDLPPYDRVTMDGIAIAYQAWQNGNRRFFVQGILTAGQKPSVLNDKMSCIEVMTGSVLPKGADTVIRYEDLAIRNGRAQVQRGVKVRRGQNVHRKGSDYKKGSLLIKQGTRVDERHAGVLASVGLTSFRASRLPRVSLLTTGDELVSAGKEPADHQIRASNGAALIQALREKGIHKITAGHLPDDLGKIKRRLPRYLKKEYDVILLTGGVSMGKKDYLPQALAALGVRQVFHKVSQRPGKPFWFGVTRRGQPVFGLPGNPVSVLTCFRRYVAPYLDKAAGATARIGEWALLTESVTFKPALTYFLPVKLDCDPKGRLRARPTPTHGSGDFAGLVKSDGFLELPAEKAHFRRGESFPLYRWKP